MHDLDRTQLEVGENLEGSFDGNEYDLEETFEFEPEYDAEVVFDQETEMELAAELLSVSSEQELDQFLGNLIKKVGGFAGRVIRSPQFRALGGILKGVAKKALPLAGRAIGTYFGGPLGGTLGGKLGSLGASLIKEVDLEGFTGDDREFEIARRFVQLAGNAVSRLAKTPPSISPVAAAQRAISAAASRVLPRVCPGNSSATPTAPTIGGSGRKSGRWVRKGRHILVLGN